MKKVPAEIPYEQLGVSPNAEQEEVRRQYQRLRKELSGEELREIQAAWDAVWSISNRVLTDALLPQYDLTVSKVDDLTGTLAGLVSKDDWFTYIDRDELFQHELAALSKVIVDETWLEQEPHQRFERAFPSAPPTPAPSPTLVAKTQAPPLQSDQTQLAARRSLVASMPARLSVAWVIVAVVVPVLILSSLAAGRYLNARNSEAQQAEAGSPTAQAGVLASQLSEADAPSLTAPEVDGSAGDGADLSSSSGETAAEFTDAGQLERNLAGEAPQAEDSNLADTQAATQPPSDQPRIRARVFTNIRRGPGLQYGVIAVLSPSEERQISGQVESGQWLQVRLSATELGWVSSDIVETIGSLEQVPDVPATP